MPVVVVLQTVRTLSALVSFLNWADVYSLLCTCRFLHTRLFSYLPTRDAILSRFVPGYSFCLEHRDMDLYQDVPISIHHLDLLLISQRTDLHLYPTHALRTLTDPTEQVRTAKLIKLTQAHSRFVLLFQSLVHSSPNPIPPDSPQEPRLHRPSPELTFPPPLAFIDHRHLPTPRPKHISKKPSASSYMISPSPSLTHNSLPRTRRPASSKRRLSILRPPDPLTPIPPPEEPETLRIRSKEWRRARSASTISPSPFASVLAYSRPPGPHTHKLHSASLDFAIDYPNAQYPSDTEFDFGQLRRPKRLFASERASSSSSSISISETRSSWNQGQGSTHSSRSSPPLSPYPSGRKSMPPLPRLKPTYPSPPFAPSIHSLLHATIRNRAPILRVFVPTQHMQSSSSSLSTPDSSLERNLQVPTQSISIQACETQLQQAGLWEHLSIGDIICNFGYIPLDDPESYDTLVYTPKVLMPSHRPSLRSFSHLPHSFHQPQQQPLKTWLIFTGHSLVPYTPPALLPLLSSPLSLPSPFYYYHIMPQGTNPLFEISQLPPHSVPPISPPPVPPKTQPPAVPPKSQSAPKLPPLPPKPQPTNNPNLTLSLIKTTTQVPSILSPTGYINVRKFAWTARFIRTRPTMPPPSHHPPQLQQQQQQHPNTPIYNHYSALPFGLIPYEVGDGWLGEWVLEYEGTKEGREVLIDAVDGKFLGSRRVWEVRRDRSGGGRVWLRLLPE